MNVISGWVLAKFLTAMPSSPDSGESMSLHLVLLDQLAHRAHRRVGRRVGRGDDEFELLAADLRAVFLHRGLKAADAVLAEHRVGAFQASR